MIRTTKYVRKPLFVDAILITNENFGEVARWCQGEIRTRAEELLVDQNSDDPRIPSTCFIHVRVHSPKNMRQTKAFVGDWLLHTEKGYKVYTGKAFELSFDLANGKV